MVGSAGKRIVSDCLGISFACDGGVVVTEGGFVCRS